MENINQIKTRRQILIEYSDIVGNKKFKQYLQTTKNRKGINEYYLSLTSDLFELGLIK